MVGLIATSPRRGVLRPDEGRWGDPPERNQDPEPSQSYRINERAERPTPRQSAYAGRAGSPFEGCVGFMPKPVLKSVDAERLQHVPLWFWSHRRRPCFVESTGQRTPIRV